MQIVTQTEYIFYNMVGIEFIRYGTLNEYQESVSLAVYLKEKTGRDDNYFFIRYAERVKAVHNMVFEWRDDPPEAFKSLETWWNMLSSQSDEECYLYYVMNVSMQITQEFGEAYDRARKIWKPAHQRQTPEEKETETDPNS
jgi:hypothetical protein